MHKPLSAPLLFLYALTLTACGGSGGSDPTTTPDPVTRQVVAGGLNDTSVTTPFAVTLIGPGGSQDGQFTPSDEEATAGGTEFSVLDPAVNVGLGSVSVLSGDRFAYIPVPDGTATPSGAVTFNGHGFLVVSESASSTVFEGLTDASLTVRFDGSANGSIRFSNFDGERQSGALPREATTGQGLTVRGVSATASGLSGGSSISGNTFSDTDFSGANFQIDGAFAGQDFSEVGGLVDITATDGSTIRAGFGAAQ